MRRQSGFRAATAGLTGAAFFSAAVVFGSGGCVSNEYRISHDELVRVAHLPPQERGAPLHVVQDLGSSDGEELEPPSPVRLRKAWAPVDAPPPVESVAPVAPVAEEGQPGPVAYEDSESDVYIGGELDLPIIHVGGGAGPVHRVGPRDVDRTRLGTGRVGPTTRGGVVGMRTSGGGHGAGMRGGSSGGGHVGPSSSGGHSSSNSGGGSSSSGGDAAAGLAVLAVVAVAAATFVAIGLIASEGIRYQGEVQMAPEQPLHLHFSDGKTRDVALVDLTIEDAIHADEAKVRDDEHYGLLLGRRDPLDRRGPAFKLELGMTTFNRGDNRTSGPAAEIQFGGFFTQQLGLMLDLGLSGGSIATAGGASAANAAQDGTTAVRHQIALELQAFPLSAGPVHFGAFGRGGVAFAGDSKGIVDGALFGGGALIEIGLTSRLALSLRGGVNTAHFDSGWSTAGTATAGVSIY